MPVAVPDGVEEDDADERDPERVADVLHRREGARGRAGMPCGEAPEHRRGEGREHESHARTGDQQARRQREDLAVSPDRRDRRRERAVPRGEQEAADGRHVAPEALRKARCGKRGGEVRDRQDGEHEARVQCAEPSPGLQIQREDEEERRHAGEERERREQARGECALPEQGRVEQGLAAAIADAPLVGGEDREDHGREGEADQRPGRPALAPALDQRQHERDQRERHERRARQVDPAGSLDPRLRHETGRQRQCDDSDRHVDQEARAPAEPEQVGLDEQPADQLAAECGQAECHPVDAECAGAIGAVVGHAHDRQDLGHHERGAEALDEARRDERLARRSEAAGGRGDGEEREADHEHAPAADPVAQAAGGDQPGGGHQAVAGDDPFDDGRAGVQIEAQRRHRHVDDEEVEHDHERRGEDDGQESPAALAGADVQWPRAVHASAPGRTGCGDLIGVHGSETANGRHALR